MKAIVKQNKESNDFILMEIPVPEIDDDEIRVQVKAIGVGIQDGYFFPANMEFPYPIGMEGSGIISKVGKDVVDIKEGDRVAFVGVTEAAIAIQPNTSISSMKVVKEGGKVIPVSGDRFTPERNIESVYFPYKMDVKEELIRIIDKIASGEINITIENVYDFEDGLDALEKVRTRRARGKSIIEIK